MVNRQAMQFAVDLVVGQDRRVIDRQVDAIALDEFVDREKRALAGISIGDVCGRIEDIRWRATGDGGLQLGVIVAAAADIFKFNTDAGLLGEGFRHRHGDILYAILVPAHEPLDGDVLRARAQCEREQQDEEHRAAKDFASIHL